MCEKFSKWCPETDDPLALALLQSKRPARLTVECPVQRHRLAAVYDLGEHGGLTFCRPASQELTSFAWGARASEDDSPLEQIDKLHDHAELVPLADLAARPSKREMKLRCRCGSFRLDAPSVARLAIAGRASVVTATRHR